MVQTAVGETRNLRFIKKIFLASLLLGKEWEQILGLAGQLPIENEAIWKFEKGDQQDVARVFEITYYVM